MLQKGKGQPNQGNFALMFVCLQLDSNLFMPGYENKMASSHMSRIFYPMCINSHVTYNVLYLKIIKVHILQNA